MTLQAPVGLGNGHLDEIATAHRIDDVVGDLARELGFLGALANFRHQPARGFEGLAFAEGAKGHDGLQFA